MQSKVARHEVFRNQLYFCILATTEKQHEILKKNIKKQVPWSNKICKDLNTLKTTKHCGMKFKT